MLGKLFQLQKGGISQIADYFWQSESTLFIGDAKYKHLAAGHNGSLSFEDISDDDNANIARPLAGRVLNPADVRQLTVYAELTKRKYKFEDVRLLLLYPFVGDNPSCCTATTWNDAQFSLVPVCLHRRERIADCLPRL
jgi:hypothetical protein